MEIANQPEAAGPSGTQRPATRQRLNKAPPKLNVPDINEDAAERKRVLNVLAQRRYRERKRRVKGRKVPGTNDDADQIGEDVGSQHDSTTTLPTSQHAVREEPDAPTTLLDSWLAVPLAAETSLDTLYSLPPLDSVALPAQFVGLEVGLSELEPFLTQPFPLAAPPTFEVPPVEPSSTIDPAALACSPTRNLFTSRRESGLDDADLSADSFLLPMTELTLLRAFLRIADRLGVTKSVWNLDAMSPFWSPAPGTSPASSGRASSTSPGWSPTSPPPTGAGCSPPSTGQSLPAAWRPTPSQRSHPHHPFLDMIPWPTVRDRVLAMLALPDDLRPPTAAGPLALVHLEYDVADGAEGMRVWGGDPFDAGSWEVGQTLFERWWFIFDRQVVEQSNRWRRLRGAPALRTVDAERPAVNMLW